MITMLTFEEELMLGVEEVLLERAVLGRPSLEFQTELTVASSKVGGRLVRRRLWISSMCCSIYGEPGLMPGNPAQAVDPCTAAMVRTAKP
jgi:hypothetical protein